LKIENSKLKIENFKAASRLQTLTNVCKRLQTYVNVY